MDAERILTLWDVAAILFLHRSGLRNARSDYSFLPMTAVFGNQKRVSPLVGKNKSHENSMKTA
jgi:hypothetical protein